MQKVCVTWEDLQVEVVGGRGTGHKFYIETFNRVYYLFSSLFSYLTHAIQRR